MIKRATISDVARESGLSVATVSRYFAGKGYPVSKDAACRIEKAADILDYTPNMVGRMLKTNSSRDIGVIIPTVRNPFYPDVLLGIEKTAARRGYQILLCNSLRNRETESRYIMSLYQKQVRGIIIASTENSLDMDRFSGMGMNIVNLEAGGSDDLCRGVEFDYKKGGALLAEHLHTLGHERIAFVTSPLTKKSRRDILEGIRSVYGENVNVVVDDTETEDETGVYEYQMGVRMALKVRQDCNCITAVIAVNDLAGAGVIRGLVDMAVDVPGDVSVAGFDNIALSSMISPELTTVEQPGFKTGQIAADMLIDMIEGIEPGEYELKPELVVRASTGKTGGKNNEERKD